MYYPKLSLTERPGRFCALGSFREQGPQIRLRKSLCHWRRDLVYLHEWVHSIDYKMAVARNVLRHFKDFEEARWSTKTLISEFVPEFWEPWYSCIRDLDPQGEVPETLANGTVRAFLFHDDLMREVWSRVMVPKFNATLKLLTPERWALYQDWYSIVRDPWDYYPKEELSSWNLKAALEIWNAIRRD